jgi:hydroxyacylglutathione hydrolase
MPLEDHLGDILAKGRAMSDVALEAAAQAAGISAERYAAIESSGVVPDAIQFAPLAGLIGLDPAKLQSIAAGWLPQPRDLGQWRHLRQIVTTQDDTTVNCYLIWDPTTRAAALFDTGWTATEARRLIAAHGLNLETLFLTHGHVDHVAALDELRQAFPRLRVRRAPAGSGEISVGALRVSARPTPGHAADGLTWVVECWPDRAPKVAMVGDAIFAGSIGRGFQSWQLALAGVDEAIFTLPPDTLLCPGHGPVTTVAEELEHNPFFPTTPPA